jgi:hypothetical protein
MIGEDLVTNKYDNNDTMTDIKVMKCNVMVVRYSAVINIVWCRHQSTVDMRAVV